MLTLPLQDMIAGVIHQASEKLAAEKTAPPSGKTAPTTTGKSGKTAPTTTKTAELTDPIYIEKLASACEALVANQDEVFNIQKGPLQAALEKMAARADQVGAGRGATALPNNEGSPTGGTQKYKKDKPAGEDPAASEAGASETTGGLPAGSTQMPNNMNAAPGQSSGSVPHATYPAKGPLVNLSKAASVQEFYQLALEKASSMFSDAREGGGESPMGSSPYLNPDAKVPAGGSEQMASRMGKARLGLARVLGGAKTPFQGGWAGRAAGETAAHQVGRWGVRGAAGLAAAGGLAAGGKALFGRKDKEKNAAAVETGPHEQHIRFNAPEGEKERVARRKGRALGTMIGAGAGAGGGAVGGQWLAKRMGRAALGRTLGGAAGAPLGALIGAGAGRLAGGATGRLVGSAKSYRSTDKTKTASELAREIILRKLAGEDVLKANIDGGGRQGPLVGEGALDVADATKQFGKQPGGPTGGFGNQGRSHIQSNAAAIGYTKKDAKGPQKTQLGQVIDEPALSAAHDSKLKENLRNTGKAGVKIAADVARELLQKIAEEGCTCEGKGECRHCRMKSAISGKTTKTAQMGAGGQPSGLNASGFSSASGGMGAGGGGGGMAPTAEAGAGADGCTCGGSGECRVCKLKAALAAARGGESGAPAPGGAPGAAPGGMPAKDL